MLLPHRRGTSTALTAFAVLALALLLSGGGSQLLGSSASAAPARPERIDLAPALPRGAERIGVTGADRQLSVDIALQPRDASALGVYAQAVSDPSSRDYHRYLSVAQLRNRFGATNAAVASVERTLRDAGLHPRAVSANGLLIGVSASTRALGRAFDTTIGRVRLADGAVAYANTRAPRISAPVAGLVQGVIGLNDLAAPHALGLAREKGIGRARADARRADLLAHSVSAATPCAAASETASGSGAYTADEIASAYGFDGLYADGDYGAGQTVGLMEFEQYATSDIQSYESCYGIDGGTASDVSTIAVDGGVDGDGASYTGGPDGSGEAALDIEQIIGLAPGADVDVYEAPDTVSGDLDAYTEMVDNPSVKVISTSWGECEALLKEDDSSAANAEATIFQEAAVAGKSVFAAAGDSGSTDCDGQSGSLRLEQSLGVDDPGSQPTVTSVGGTSLSSASDTAAQSVWNDSAIANGAGGGGVSMLWTMPSYQSGASTALGVIGPGSSGAPCAAASGDCREVPDVSADADPQTGYTVAYDNGWTVIGGTSAAAPLWAALTALADASSTCGGHSIGEANPVLYGIADDAGADAAAFTDVTSGDNDYTPSGYGAGLYAARTGYDMATGLGTPNATALAPDMCDVAAGLPIPSVAATTPASTTTPTLSTISPSAPAASAASASAPVVSAAPATGTPTTATVTRPSTQTCPSATDLYAGPLSLAVGGPHHRAGTSIGVRLPAGCGRETLSLVRRVASAQRAGTDAPATLSIELLSSSGRLLSTLTTMSSRGAKLGYQSWSVNLTRYAGRQVTLRLLAAGGGAQAVTFTLRSVVLTAA